MTKAPNADTWTSLREQKPSYSDAFATSEVGDARGSLYGVDERGDLHLLVPVCGGPKKQKLCDLRGLRVRHRHLSDGRECIDLEANACHESIFTPCLLYTSPSPRD